VSPQLSEPLRELVADLQNRGFLIAHNVLDGVTEDENTVVVLQLSDGLSAGGNVLLARVAGEWEVLIDIGRGHRWPTCSVHEVLQGNVTADPKVVRLHTSRAIAAHD